MKYLRKTVGILLSVTVLLSSSLIAFADSYEEDIPAPNDITPSTVDVVRDGKARLKVKWEKALGVTGYYIYRSTNPSTLGKKIATIKKQDTTSYVDMKVGINKTYCYTVKTYIKDAGNVSVSIYGGDLISNTVKVKKTFRVKAYAYTGGGRTCTGKKAAFGRVAVDPKVIKLGTWLYIEGYGVAQASDKGSAINGKTVDVYFPSKKDVRKWGVKRPKIYVLG